MLPEVKYFKPGVDTSWLIRQYEFINYDSDNELADKFFPREDAAIVLNFGNLPQMLAPVNQILPPIFIAPICPTANSISITGQNDAMIIVCRPTVLSRVLGISLRPGSGIYIPLPEEKFRPVWEKMRTQETAERRIQTFSSFIYNLQPGKYMPDETDMIYNLILQKGINTSLSDIIGELAISERTVQRRFFNRLGVSPKVLIRIMRINHLWETTSKGGKIDYQDLVFLGHYFDQTHMIKDFKSITGETPFAFFRRNLGVAKIFSGK